MKENLEGYSLEEAHKLYTDCPELYRHIVRLDEYIDNLEDKLNKLLISDVSQQRELLIGLLTKLENGGGSAFIDKEQIVDNYLKAN